MSRAAARRARAQRLLGLLERLPYLSSSVPSSEVEMRSIVEEALLYREAVHASMAAMRADVCPAPHPLHGDGGLRDSLDEKAEEAITKLAAALDDGR